jgi:hypothetical protein
VKSDLVDRLLSEARWLTGEGGASNDTLAKMMEEAAASLGVALELLREIEWNCLTPMDDPQCPSCYGLKEEGHDADCKLAALINR